MTVPAAMGQVGSDQVALPPELVAAADRIRLPSERLVMRVQQVHGESGF